MKRLLFFITTALLITAAGFADRGYGKIKWEPMSHLEFLKYNYGEGWKVWNKEEEKEEQPTEERKNKNSSVIHDREIVICRTEKLGETVFLFIVYSTAETNLTTYYTPMAAIYFLNNEKKEELYKKLENKNLIFRDQKDTSKEFREENTKQLNDDYKNVIESLAINEKNEVNILRYDGIVPYNEDKCNYSIYEYNEDTFVSVYDNILEDQMIIIYTYHEPDY